MKRIVKYANLLVSRFGSAWLYAWLISVLAAGFSRTLRPPSVHVHLLPYLYSVVFGGVAWLLPAAVLVSMPRRPAQAIVSLLLGFWTVFFVVANVVLYLQFGKFTSRDMLDYIVQDSRYMQRYLSSYLSGWLLAAFLLACLFASWGWYRAGRPKSGFAPVSVRVKRLLAVVAVTSVAALGQVFVSSSDDLLLPESSFATASYRSITTKASKTVPLHDSPRVQIVPVQHPEKVADVLFVINETWESRGLKFDDPSLPREGMPKLGAWLQQNRDRCVIFHRAYANSNCTDLSVPTLHTGVAPYRSTKRLHRAALSWSWGRASGMYTIFATSQIYHWAGFDKFFLAHGPQAYETADTLGAPAVNDLGADDMLAAKALQMLVARAPKGAPTFVVFNSNAMHAPFQNDSDELPESAFDGCADRHARAQRILDEATHLVLGTVSDKEALTVMTGDHGDSSLPPHKINREISFYESTIRVPFVVCLPQSYASAHPGKLKALRMNANRNVEHIDVIPTIADVLGLLDSKRNSEAVDLLDGLPLTRPVPPHRTIIALDTNDTRHWKEEGFGIFWDNWRFVASTPEGFQLFDLSTDPHEMKNLWGKVPQATEHVRHTVASISHLSRIAKHIQTLNPNQLSPVGSNVPVRPPR